MRRKNPGGRIYPGEFVLPGDLTAAQREFLQAIKRTAPELLSSLRKELLPAYRKLAPKSLALDELLLRFYPLAWGWAESHRLVTGDRLFPQSETCQGLSPAEVAERYATFKGSPEQTFFFPFAAFAILGTLAAWHTKLARAGQDWMLPYWPFPIGDGSDLLRLRSHDHQFKIADLFEPPPSHATSVPFTFECPGWNPLRETRQNAERRIHDEAGKAIKRALDQAENLMRRFDVPRAPAKLSAEHFDWLVLFQLCGHPYRRISRDWPGKPHAETVSLGVEDAAEKVIGPGGWRDWLRKSPPGRPKAT